MSGRSKQVTRRAVMAQVVGGAVCGCGLSWHAADAQISPQGRIFCLDRNAPATGNFGTEFAIAAGPVLATYVGQETVMLELFFGLRSTIYLRDGGGTFAYIPPKSDARTDAKIIFSSNDINRHRNQPYGLVKISGIYAHETAHIFQDAHGVIGSLVDQCKFGNKMLELHADYLAGAYMAWREQNKPVSAVDAASMFFSLGDEQYHRHDHHGTPKERFLAFATGYQDCKIDRTDSITAGVKGLKYVRTLCS